MARFAANIAHQLSKLLAGPEGRLGLVALVAAGLSLAGPVLEGMFHIHPCPMCMWQRYAHYAILGLAVAGVAAHKFLPLGGRRALLGCQAGVVLAAGAGLAVAVWQVAAQQGWLPWPPGCTSASNPLLAAPQNLLDAMQGTRVIPCDAEVFRLFGLSLAAWNIPSMLVVMGLVFYRGKSPKPNRTRP